MFSLLPVLLLVGTTAAQVPRYIGSASLRRPGFSNIYEHRHWSDPRDRYSLLISTFSPIPFTRDDTYMFYRIGNYLDSLSSVEPYTIYDNYTWPREPSQTPFDVFGFETITQPDGFLLAGKNHGSVYVTDMRGFPYLEPTTHNIVEDWQGDFTDWFYHRVIWKDMDGDGRKDALCCRARAPTIGRDQQELVWFRHPEDPFSGELWEETFINNECDTFAILETMVVNGEPIEALFTLGYFTEQIMVMWSNHPTGSWADPANILTRRIDQGGNFFDLELVDMNMDGGRDLFVTINAPVGGSVVVYEVPDDFRTGIYTKHVLAEGFYSRSGLAGGGAPGTGQTFDPDPQGGTHEKPWVLLTGDDDGRCYYMVPNNQNPRDWTYDLITFVDEGEGQIIGRPSVMDVTGDGFPEVFVPAYQRNEIQVFTFAP